MSSWIPYFLLFFIYEFPTVPAKPSICRWFSGIIRRRKKNRPNPKIEEPRNLVSLFEVSPEEATGYFLPPRWCQAWGWGCHFKVTGWRRLGQANWLEIRHDIIWWHNVEIYINIIQHDIIWNIDMFTQIHLVCRPPNNRFWMILFICFGCWCLVLCGIVESFSIGLMRPWDNIVWAQKITGNIMGI